MAKYLCLMLLVSLSGCGINFGCSDEPSAPVVATPRAVNQDNIAYCQSLTPLVMALMDRHDEYVVADSTMAPAEKQRALNESLLVRQSFCLRCVELYPIYETLMRCLDRLDAYAEYEISDAMRRMTLRDSHEVRATVQRLIGTGVYVVPGRKNSISTYSGCGGTQYGVEQQVTSPCGTGYEQDARSMPPPPPPPQPALMK